jgi:NADH:ubiquinone oxidoreductase subunit 4 (subunit M)
MLSAIIFLPMIAGIVVAIAGRDQRRARLIALTAVVVELLLTLVVFAG